MPNAVFHFKQFSIHQDQCAMKVGTDGVLLGAWAGRKSIPAHILDVGTGTGLIALMLAQRFPDAKIHSLEIEEKAAVQAKQNVINSPFRQRVTVEHCNFFNWHAPILFDLVVCNPPFYAHAHPAATTEREMARHGNTFNIKAFIRQVKAILATGGRLALILPTAISEAVLDQNQQLYISRQCRVFPNPTKSAHRYLTEFSLTDEETEIETIFIEDQGRHQYHSDYISLTRDFYLNF